MVAMSSSSSNDEVMRKRLKPNPSAFQVLDAIRSVYNVNPEQDVKILASLESYDDCNYCVELNGVKYLAKFYNGVETANYLRYLKQDNNSSSRPSAIHLYSSIFTHLQQYDVVKTSVPLQIPKKEDEEEDLHCHGDFVSIHSLPVTSQEDSPSQIALCLLSWVEGSTMSSKHINIETLAQAGQYLAKVCHAMDALPEYGKTAAMRYHAWDTRNTLDLEPFVRYITIDSRRSLVMSVLDAFRKELVESKVEFRMGVLQGDFNDANIILDQDGNVDGVIDFGDSTYSWRVLDVSVAMAYAMLSSYGKLNRGISAAAAFLRGFHLSYPLTVEERKHLRLLVAARLSCSVTLGAYSYQQNPQNEYLLLHSQPAWKALELLWGKAQEDDNIHQGIQDMFDRACDGHFDIVNGIIDCSDIAFPDPCVTDPMKRGRVISDEILNKKPRLSCESNNETTDIPSVITFVTGNKKKLEEVKRILTNGPGKFPCAISNHKLDLPELQGSPHDIAKEKCALAAKELNAAVITEDTSLCFNALNNLPGPYIKWFLDDCGHDGLNNMIAFTDDKSAYAQTVVGYCPGPNQDVIIFDGRTSGRIVPPRGSLEFGWDPIFEPDEGTGLTYAEMSKDQKDAISHRSRAFAQLRAYLMAKNL